MHRLKSLLPLLALVALGLGLFLAGAFDHFDPHHIVEEEVTLHARIVAHPLLARLLHVGAMTLAIATGLPGAVLVVFAGGILFGVVEGTVLSSLGTCLGALALFLASRRAFADGSGHAPALVERLRAGYHAYPVSYTMFLRLVPFFPFGAVTVALAWLRCPLWLFMLATVSGGSVMIAFETALGAGLADTIVRDGHVSLNILGHPQVLLPLLGMAMFALTPILVGRLRRRHAGAAPPP
ncbi:MAG: TVP38/TMEM64 family protein [Dokdonella sp.]|uniref:TVP38/TMEM64 family protein n=1 Tax=Dokdonella sp. TaxID=2291710 RepID=UPI0025C0D415|nr:VTT domain-containing protein [Dokdonella sp.]MBX3699469.1 TVP38/TMEM64 family protein [Dokdonella sp.]MCW5577821.1 TVP38/TMEM64 family protein [Dokdonella sp.]